MYRIRKLATGVAAIGIAIGLSSTAALAGEITPHGFIHGDDDAPLPARSECAYSGLNDGYYLPPEGADHEPDRVQAWGQLPRDTRKFLSTVGAAPGDSCRP